LSESQSVPEPAPSPEGAPAAGLSQLGELYLEPRSGFTSILRTPDRWWLPLLVCMALHFAFSLVWVSKMDPVEHARIQMEESSFTRNLPPEQKEQQIQGRARSAKFVVPVIFLLIPIMGAVVMGGINLLIYRFFYGAQVTFKQSLAVNTWTGLTVATVTFPLMLVVYAAKGDWNIDPSVVLQANLSLLFTKGQVAPALYGLAESIDLVSAWTLFLLATGYGVIIRKPTSAALWGVLVPWCVLVLIKLGLLALMG